MYIIIVLQYIYQYTTTTDASSTSDHVQLYVYRYGTVGIQYHSSTDHYELQGFTLCCTTTTVAL